MFTQFVFGKRVGEAFRTGFWGESIAARYLKKLGMKILVRNWKHGREELDLVCIHGDVLIFVEVKTRKDEPEGKGYFAVNRRKKRALLRVCRAYISQLKISPRHFRFDIVEVISGTGSVAVVNHFENVKLFSRHFHGQ